MLFKEFKINTRQEKDLFKIKSYTHKSTWVHYSECYSYSTQKIINKGLSKNYALNSLCRPVLFLMRHGLEIHLKEKLYSQNIALPASHVFSEIVDCFPNSSMIPMGYMNILSNPIFSGDGSSLRYYRNEAGIPYFNSERIKFAEIIEQYNTVKSELSFDLKDICDPFDYSDKKKVWDLTFHMGECTGLASIRTQFDGAIELLTEGILTEGWDIKKMYLPLLFFVRHSVELGLKSNIRHIQSFSSIINPRDFSKEHSLSTLWNCYADYLQKIENSNIQFSDVVARQYDEYKPKYIEFNELLHQLDNHSRVFRFPIDKNGAPYSPSLLNKDIINVLKLYYFVDPFITFTNLVLEEENALI